MKTLMLQADDKFIIKAKEMIIAMAQQSHTKINLSDDTDAIKAQLEADIKAYIKGELKTALLGSGWKYL